MAPPSTQRGFTLLELMVALTIFTLIGLGAHALLSSMLKAREAQAQHSREFTQLQKALWLIAEDVTQMDTASLTIPAREYAVSFLRQGASNPLGLPRSNSLQIAYAVENHALKRYFWLAEARNGASQGQVLLDNISNFALRPLTARSVEISFNTPSFGMVRQVIEVPEP